MYTIFVLPTMLRPHLCPKQAKWSLTSTKCRELRGNLEDLLVIYLLYIYAYDCVCVTVWLYVASVPYELICPPHLSRSHLHPCVPASDGSVPAECVSVSSSQCPAVASSFTPRSTLMGPFGCGSDCGLDHPAEFSLSTAHWEGERVYRLTNYVIFWREYVKYLTDLFVNRFLKDWSSEMDPDWNIPLMVMYAVYLFVMLFY